MAFNESTGTFARGYTDSTQSECVSINNRALPIDVSTVEILGDSADLAYGGAFELSDSGTFGCGGGLVLNAVTGALTCPPGFTEQTVGRVLTPGDGALQCGAMQTACTRLGGAGLPPAVHYGGQFQVQDVLVSSCSFFEDLFGLDCDDGLDNSVLNPVTGTFGCPRCCRRSRRRASSPACPSRPGSLCP